MIEVFMLLFGAAIAVSIVAIVVRAVRVAGKRAEGGAPGELDADHNPDHDQGSGFDPSDR